MADARAKETVAEGKVWGVHITVQNCNSSSKKSTKLVVGFDFGFF